MKPQPERTVTPLRLSDEFSPSLEANAKEGERLWLEGRRSLAEALPLLRPVRELFTSHKRNSIEFRGCRSWGQYCRDKLHCTPQAIVMAEKRLRLGEAAREIERQRRRERRWGQQAEEKRQKLMRETEFGRARNDHWVRQMAEGQHEYEQAVDAGLVEDEVEKILHFPDTDEIIRKFLSLSEEDVAAFDQIIAAADSLAPHLVEAIKALRGKHTKLARDVREDLDIRVDGGNVLEMPAR